MIQSESITYEYPGVRALDNVSFNIQAGTVTSLVGPNGSGKTTLLKCLAALSRPLSGRVLIGGYDTVMEPRSCHAMLGYVSDFYGLYDNMRVRQYLTYFHYARRQDVHKLGNEEQDVEAYVEALARRLDLEAKLDERAGALSRGMRQRLAIAQAIVHTPKVLLLDEPASGLDPEARHSLALLLTELGNKGMTIVVSSHILAELDDYSTNVLIISNGKVVEHKSLVPEQGVPRVLSVSMAGDWDGMRPLIAEYQGAEIISQNTTTATLAFSGSDHDMHLLLKSLLDAGAPVCGFHSSETSLQDQYLLHMKRSRQSAGPEAIDV